MRVLLAGAAGFTGRVTLELLRERHEVTAFDICTVEGYKNGIKGDVLDYGAVAAAMEGHDAVVNTIMAPNGTHEDNGPGFTINVTGVYNLLEAARVHRVKRFVHTSSAVVHLAYRTAFRANDLYPLKAWGSYAISKILQEELARNFYQVHGISIAAIRPWGIIDSERMVTTDGKTIARISWEMIDRRDVASALVCALEAEDIGYECFYVTATPGGYKATDVAKTEARLGWKPAFTFDVDL
ncbi:MAG: NAD-dependent epimerase/dehydratase family protein [Candidatus Latescibacteria bacterium]|nr:NAD-dependent epimerase/dehydratase family protein [Candidatus Latescibacterota bacterium]